MTEPVLITQNTFYMFQVATYGCVALIGMLVFIFAKSPAKVFLKAWIKKMDVIPVFQKNGVVKLEAAKYEQESFKTKSHGIFSAVRDAMFKWEYGPMGGICASFTTRMLPPYMLNSCYEIMRAGFENLTQAEEALKGKQTEEGKIVEQLEYYRRHNIDISPKALAENNFSKEVIAVAKKIENGTSIEVRTEPDKKAQGVMLDISIVKNFMIYNRSPETMHKMVEHKIAEDREKMNGPRWTMDVGIIIAIIMAAAIAYYMISQGDGGGAGGITDTLKGVGDAAGGAATGMGVK